MAPDSASADDTLNVVRTTISLPSSVDARARLKAGRKKFSAYIRELVERDIADDPTLDATVLSKLADLAGSMGLRPSALVEMLAAALVEAAEASGGKLVLPIRLHSQEALADSHALAAEKKQGAYASRTPPGSRDAARLATMASKLGSSSKASKVS